MSGTQTRDAPDWLGQTAVGGKTLRAAETSVSQGGLLFDAGQAMHGDINYPYSIAEEICFGLNAGGGVRCPAANWLRLFAYRVLRPRGAHKTGRPQHAVRHHKAAHDIIGRSGKGMLKRFS